MCRCTPSNEVDHPKVVVVNWGKDYAFSLLRPNKLSYTQAKSCGMRLFNFKPHPFQLNYTLIHIHDFFFLDP